MTLDVISFSAAMSTREKGVQWQHAVSLLEDMRMTGVTLDVISFREAISACGKTGHWQQALSLLKTSSTEKFDWPIVQRTSTDL